MNIITMDQSITDVDLPKTVIEDLGVIIMDLMVIVMEQGKDIVMEDVNITTVDQSIKDVDLLKMVIEYQDMVIMDLTVIVMVQGNDIATDPLASEDVVADIMAFTAMDPAAITLVLGLGAILNYIVLEDVGHLTSLGEDTGEVIATCVTLVIMAHSDTKDHALTILRNAHHGKLTSKNAALVIRRSGDVGKEKKKMDRAAIKIRIKILVIQCLFKELFWKRLQGRNLCEVLP